MERFWRCPFVVAVVVATVARGAVAMTVRATPATNVERAAPPRVLVTTGYWRVTKEDCIHGLYRCGSRDYVERMPLVMSLNAPMVVYGDSFGVEKMKEVRKNATRNLVGAVQLPVGKFGPCADHHEELYRNQSKWTHWKNLPALKLGCIWDGKMSLLARTAHRHRKYDWYAWLDIGMHTKPEWRKALADTHDKSWPDAAKLVQLPGDKISVSHSFRCGRCKKGDWSFCHCVAATAMLLPRAVVSTVSAFFSQKVEECLNFYRGRDEPGFPCMSEQVVLSQMALEKPELFNFVGKGYGAIAANLTTDFARTGRRDLFEWLSTAEGAITVPL